MHVVDGIRLVPPYAGPHCLCHTVQRDRQASSTDSMPVRVRRYAILQPEDYQGGLYQRCSEFASGNYVAHAF